MSGRHTRVKPPPQRYGFARPGACGCYRASNWTNVGTALGRGPYDNHTGRDLPKIDIWLRPLRNDWR